jgi:hypothetical protein
VSLVRSAGYLGVSARRAFHLPEWAVRVGGTLIYDAICDECFAANEGWVSLSPCGMMCGQSWGRERDEVCRDWVKVLGCGGLVYRACDVHRLCFVVIKVLLSLLFVIVMGLVDWTSVGFADVLGCHVTCHPASHQSVKSLIRLSPSNVTCSH